MQKKPLIGLTLAAALIALGIMGCSAITPAPEVKIISISQSAFGGNDTIVTTITFESKNKVDAIITTQQCTYIGPGTAPIKKNSDIIHYTFFVNGKTTAPMDITLTGMNALRTAVGGSPATMWLKFWGEDAYGYNKTFSDSVSVSF
ncbi:hypothetical protein HY768_08655 [candidate division TA06 bacterium]|uniref:Uncharacterized protein n=1 Tax=candidate division TA06 bacterium TaxID=2250710 RepID=A0A933ICH3_UNCT6|nr:hypothetical protein [candidate division TA06 bacterium]